MFKGFITEGMVMVIKVLLPIPSRYSNIKLFLGHIFFGEDHSFIHHIFYHTYSSHWAFRCFPAIIYIYKLDVYLANFDKEKRAYGHITLKHRFPYGY